MAGVQRDLKTTASSPERPEKPSVCVLLAVYNGMLWLPAQLDSILEQRGVRVQVVASVDVSSDESLTYLQARASRDARISILPYGERFGAAAPNFFRLIRETDFSSVEFVSLSDQDDIWFPWKLARAVERMNAESADGFSSNVIGAWEDGRRKLVRKASKQRHFDYLFEGPGPGCTFLLSTKLIMILSAILVEKRDLVAELDWHDWFIYAFARSRGFRWVIDPRPGMLYRQHGSNQLGMRSGVGALLTRVRSVGTGYAFEQARRTAGILGVTARKMRRLQSMKNWDYLSLSAMAVECRRGKVDQLLFAAACCVMFFLRLLRSWPARK